MRRAARRGQEQLRGKNISSGASPRVCAAGSLVRRRIQGCAWQRPAV